LPFFSYLLLLPCDRFSNRFLGLSLLYPCWDFFSDLAERALLKILTSSPSFVSRELLVNFIDPWRSHLNGRRLRRRSALSQVFLFNPRCFSHFSYGQFPNVRRLRLSSELRRASLNFPSLLIPTISCAVTSARQG